MAQVEQAQVPNLGSMGLGSNGKKKQKDREKT